jgi:hypothetical protein
MTLPSGHVDSNIYRLLPAVPAISRFIFIFPVLKTRLISTSSIFPDKQELYLKTLYPTLGDYHIHLYVVRLTWQIIIQYLHMKRQSYLR